MSKPAMDISTLSPEERLELIAVLWDSLEDHEVPLTAAQRIELDRRLADLETRGPAGRPWSEVEADLRRRGG